MKLLELALPVVLMTAACGYRGQRATNDASYTTQTSKSTTVTVHPPPPEPVRVTRAEPVGRTQTTSAELVVDRAAAPITASAQPDVSGRNPDRRLSDRIQRELVSDGSMKDIALDRVRITAVGSRVTLRGLVPTMADKVAIEQRVREVKGVEAVDNVIEVLR